MKQDKKHKHKHKHKHKGRHGRKHHHADLSTSVSGVRLFVTMLLNFLITAVEVIGGLVSGSLSLLSDALHNFSDGIALIISYIAIRLTRQPHTTTYTFGLKRAEILAAAINAGVLIVICFYLFKESYERLVSPQPIKGGLMITVATVGLIANVIGTLLLKKGSQENINIRSAYLHLLGDAVSSAAVIIGGLCIYFFQVYWVDPILTVLISIYILEESYQIVKEAVNVLMMGTPQRISIENIREELEEIPGIQNLHHVHLWRLSEKNVHFEAHIDVEDENMPVSQTTRLGEEIEEKLKQNHGITHVTLQFESDRCKSKKLV
jgi:cobalt-zinc-cadmium efflux system protein